jgi:signal transduction histidine kinase
MPSPPWLPRWGISLFICVGYLASLLSTKHLTLVSFLLFTGTYGAWLSIFQSRKRFDDRPHLRWWLTLFCLACVSQFISLPGTNFYWLSILPTITAGLMLTIKPRFLGLLATGVIWLSLSFTFSLITRHWDVGGQESLLFSFLITLGLVTMIRELALANIAKDALNAKLASAHTQLQEYSAQVEELSVIRERNRIAREIHDTLGHSLTLLSVQLETATQLEARGDPRLHEELREARRVAKACLTDVRHSVEALRPDEASTDSLQERLRRLVAEFATTCREPRITLDLEEVTHPLNPELRLALYRCAQEALTNIRKHAHATKALLRISTSDEQVELTVLDNGQGCEPIHKQRASSFGLRGMRERVALLDGILRAGPEPGHGWRVEVVLPLTPRGQAEGSETRSSDTKEKVSLWES